MHTFLAVLYFVCCFFLWQGIKGNSVSLAFESRTWQQGTGRMCPWQCWCVRAVLCCLPAVCSTANANQKVFPKQSTREYNRCFSCSDELQPPCLQGIGILVLVFSNSGSSFCCCSSLPVERHFQTQVKVYLSLGSLFGVACSTFKCKIPWINILIYMYIQ